MTSTVSLLRQLCDEGKLTRGTALNVLGLKALATLAEGVGVAMLVPVFEMAGQTGDVPADAERSAVWRVVANAMDGLGLPMTVEALLAVIVVAVLIRQLLVYWHRIYLVSSQQRMIATLRTAGVSECFGANLAYHDKHPTGAIVNDLAQETQRSVAVAFAVISAIGNTILTGIYVVGMGLAAGWIALAVLAGASALAPAMRRLMRNTRSESDTLASANRAFSDLLIERLRAVRLLKLTQSENREQHAVGLAVESARSAAYALAKMQAVIPLFVEPIGALVLAGLFYGGVRLLGLPFELVIVIILVVVRLIPVIQEIAKAVQVVLAGTGSMKFVVERFSSARDAREIEGSGKSMPIVLRDGIQFQNVVYGYEVSEGNDRKAALDGVSVTIPAGKFTAIVGPSGAGKSTLVDLIPRLRIPTAGALTIDGIALDEFTISDLRGGIAFVPQAPLLLAGTLADHIRFGAPDLSQSDVERAADLAGIHSFIAGLPDQYETELGENGAGLSGGQKQRLDLARAIAQKAAVLILDEPASNLDPESEQAFRRALDQIRQSTDTTIILIAHRFASIVDADVILVMEQGRVAASGTHQDLQATNTWYRLACSASDISRADERAEDLESPNGSSIVPDEIKVAG